MTAPASRRGCALVLVGWGAIGQSVGGMLAARCPAVRIVAVGLRDVSRLRAPLPPGAVPLSTPEALAGLGADLVIEAAGRDSVLPWGRAALGGGMDFAVSSTSAFADPAALDDLRRIAEGSGAQLIVPPGALGGIDALAAAARMGLAVVEHRIVKPPAAWRGTAAEGICDLDTLERAKVLAEDSADAVASRFPQNANVAMITALAGLGAARTTVRLIADPAAVANRHEIVASGAFGRIEVRLENAPLPGNPKSSAMTALGLVRLVENRVAALVI